MNLESNRAIPTPITDKVIYDTYQDHKLDNAVSTAFDLVQRLSEKCRELEINCHDPAA